MDSFWTNNWWAIPAWLLGVLALIAALVHARKNPDAALSKVVFVLFPLLNPDRERSARAARPSLLWLVAALVLFLLVMELQGW